MIFTDIFILVSLCMLSVGFQINWAGPAMFVLTKGTNPPFKLASQQTSMLASTLFVGNLLGAITAFYLANKWSRSKLVFLTSIPFLLSYSIFTFWQSLYPFLFARLLGGFATGLSYGVAPLYVCEISSPKIRGILGTILQISCGIGGILVYYLIPFTSLETSSLVFIGIAATQLILCLFIPESPYFLLLNQNQQEARKVLQKLRNRDDVEIELQNLISNLEIKLLESKVTIRELVANSNYRKGVLLSCLTMLNQQLSGTSGMQAYSQDIFDTAVLPISTDLCGVLQQVVGTSTVFLTGSVIDIFGRRPLMHLSSSIVFVALLSLGSYYFLQYILVLETGALPYTPLVSMLAYMIGGCIGIGPLPYIISNELMPSNIRPLGGLVLTTISSLCGILTTVLFQILDEAIGKFAPMWLYAVMFSFCGILVFFYLPETKGKSLDEIHNKK